MYLLDTSGNTIGDVAPFPKVYLDHAPSSKNIIDENTEKLTT